MSPASTTKWPKYLPPLSLEDQAINDDFMEYWHQIAPRRFALHDRWNHTWPARHRPPEFLRTLEVGAGLGEHLRYEALSPAQLANYVGLEFRPNMTARLRQACPGIQVRQGDIQTRLDFPDGWFDRVVAIHVLEHLPNLPAAVREMHRLLRPETGSLTIVIPCEGSLAHRLARRISSQPMFEKRYARPYRMFIAREHLNRPSEIMAELARCFKRTRIAWFPLGIPLMFCNLAIAATFHPHREVLAA